MNNRSKSYMWSLLSLVVSLGLSVALGAVFIPPGTLTRILLSQLPGSNILADWPASFTTILIQIRLPHTMLVLLSGAALAGSGAAYQGLFRNPLADPYLIGVASGAGFGAVLAMTIQWPNTILGLFTIPIAAFVGAISVVYLVYHLARVNRTIPTTTLILAGVALSAFTTSLTSFMMLRSDEELRRALSWLLGGSIIGGWEPVLVMLPYIVIGLGTLVVSGHALNVLQFGEEQAQQMGLPVERAKLMIIIAASLTTATAVAFSGLIGFIGLIVPHLVRMLWGTDYKQLIPLSIIGGSTALLIADTLARVLLAPQALPVGIVTALAGAPFFLWILRRVKSRVYW